MSEVTTEELMAVIQAQQAQIDKLETDLRESLSTMADVLDSHMRRIKRLEERTPKPTKLDELLGSKYANGQ